MLMFNGFALLIQEHNQHAAGREVSDDLITYENVFNLLLSLTKGNKTDQHNVSTFPDVVTKIIRGI